MSRLHGLFAFFRESCSFVQPDEQALSEAGHEAGRYANYHKRIVRVSVLLGAIGGAAGLTMAIFLGRDLYDGTAEGRDFSLMIYAPFLGAAVGLLAGVAVMCATAPRTFLMGPVGRKWMKLIGTENLLFARLICVLIGLCAFGVAVGPFIAQVLWPPHKK